MSGGLIDMECYTQGRQYVGGLIDMECYTQGRPYVGWTNRHGVLHTR